MPVYASPAVMKNNKLKEFFHFLKENSYPNLPEEFSASISFDDEYYFQVYVFPCRPDNFWSGSDLRYLYNLCEILDLNFSLWERNGVPVVKVWYRDRK